MKWMIEGIRQRRKMPFLLRGMRLEVDGVRCVTDPMFVVFIIAHSRNFYRGKHRPRLLICAIVKGFNVGVKPFTQRPCAFQR